MKNKVKCTIIALALTSTMLFCTVAGAHDLWIETQDFRPADGQPVKLTLAYDHALPATEFLPNENLKEIYMLDSTGRRIAIRAVDEKIYQSEEAAKKDGGYLVVASQKGRFWTKTTEGYKSGQSKKGLSGVIGCTHSMKFAKAVLGTGAGAVIGRAVGHDMEIIPQKNPADLKTGDYLSVTVHCKGHPLAGCQLMGTYTGFSTDKNTFAYATRTDAQGNARIKLVNAGVWLLTAGNKEKYPDAAECDENSYSASLTFDIGKP